MADDVRWMSYAELADVLGIGGDSARNLVRRRKWSRQAGNDGLTRVGVPVDYLAEHGKADPPSDGAADGASDPPADPPISPPSNPPIEAAAVTALERHIERLEGQLAAVSAARAAARAQAGQVAVLEAVLEIERTRLGEARVDAECWRVEADRWREVATAPRGLWAWFRRSA